MKYPLKPVADHLASKGRHGDDSLVHVSRDELRGLAALHPEGRLPINPDTGHPEAFSLGGILGGLLGGAAGMFVGMPALGAAAGSGLGTYAESGDLGKGIASGLLSYGLGSAIGTLGGGTEEVASDALKGWGEGAAAQGAGAGLSQAAPSLLDPSLMPGMMEGAGSSALQGVSGAALNAPAPSFMDSIGSGISDKFSGQMDMFGRAAQNATNPEALWNTFGKNAMKTTLPIGLGAYGMLGGGEGGQQTMPQQPYYPAASTQGTGRQYMGPPSGYRPGIDPEWRYFQGGYKDGGKVVPKESPPRITFDKDGNMQMNIRGAEEYGKYYDDMKKDHGPRGYETPNSMSPRPEVRFAAGGQAISGPGGGLDDAIPAIIDGKHPAQLSSGEFVTPAAVVSALGNGSTEEGIRQLEAQNDRILKAKFGSTNRKPNPIKPNKVMVA